MRFGLRAKYFFMTNLWFLAQMKQPGRPIYSDFDKNTFMEFLDKLLDRDNSNFHKEVGGSHADRSEMVILLFPRAGTPKRGHQTTQRHVHWYSRILVERAE